MVKEDTNSTKTKKSVKSNLLLTIILVTTVGVGAFFAGMKYQQGKQPSRLDFQAMHGERQGQGFPGGPQLGTEIVRGEIISKNDDSVTVKLPDESSKIVLLSDNTQINKASEATRDDLNTGEQIMVVGKTNSDGSVSATQIQLNFEFVRREFPQD